METKIEKNINVYVYIFLFLLTMTFWKRTTSFFWGDEWSYLKILMDNSNPLEFIFTAHSEHFIPIFKLVYFLEINIFGVNHLLYGYTNLLVHSVIAYFFYKLLVDLFKERSYAFLFAAVYAVHPINYMHLEWAFQICLSLHLLFQVLFVYFSLKYFKEKLDKYYWYALFLLLLQNFTFGNGLFMPSLLILGLLMWESTEKKIARIALPALIQIGFLIVQLTFMVRDATSNLSIENIPDLSYAFLYFVSSTIASSAVFIFNIKGIFLGWFFGGGFLLLIILKIKKNKALLPFFMFFLAWIVLVTISIPLARTKYILAGTWRLYYNALPLLPILICFAYLSKPLFEYLESKLQGKLILIYVSVLSIVFLMDQRLVNTFSVRSLRNKMTMHQAIKAKIDYRSVLDEEDITTDMYKGKKEVYLHWRSKTKFILSNETMEKIKQ